MATTILGYAGTLTAGGNTLDFMGAWSFDGKRDIKKTGPYITPTSTGNFNKAIGGLDGSGSLSGDVFTGANAGRAALIAALTGATRIAMNLAETGGLTLDIPQAVINNVKLENKSDDVVKITFDFEVDGTFTLT